SPVGKFPGMLRCAFIVFNMFDIRTALQHDYFQSLLAQFLGCPSPADTGADYDSVKNIFCHSSRLVFLSFLILENAMKLRIICFQARKKFFSSLQIVPEAQSYTVGYWDFDRSQRNFDVSCAKSAVRIP